MKFGIRWKIFGSLVLMAIALLTCLLVVGRRQVAEYAADRELVDALNDAQLAAGAIGWQLQRVDQELTELSIDHLRAPQSRDQLKEKIGKLSGGQQAHSIYLNLDTMSRADAESKINRLREPMDHDERANTLGDEPLWIGPIAKDDQMRIESWAIYPLFDQTSANEKEPPSEYLFAELDLTPLLKQTRYSRVFVSYLNRDGKIVFAPDPRMIGREFPRWNDFASIGDGEDRKAKRLQGERYDCDADSVEGDWFSISEIAGNSYTGAVYRQATIRFEHAEKDEMVQSFGEFINEKRDEYREEGVQRAEWLKAEADPFGKLRIRAACSNDVNKIQEDLLQAWCNDWRNNHELAQVDFSTLASLEYESEMEEFSVCMVGIRFPPKTGSLSSDNPDMTLAMAFSVDEIKKAATSRLFGPAVSLGLVALVFCILGVAYAWYVTQPLMVMTEAAQQLTRHVSGDEECDCESAQESELALPVMRQDEVGALARAFSEMSEQVIASNCELNDRVERRTQELATSKAKLEELVETLRRTSRDLQEQRDRAELADKAKTGFLATVSHEMKTPLHHLNGFAGRLRRGKLDERQELCVDRIFQAIQQLKHLIGDVLDYQKILLGGMGIELEQIELHHFCARIAESASERAEERGNRLVLDDQFDRETFVTDPRRLEQVLNNLLANACKFTEDGEIRLSVRRQEATPDKAEMLCFEVTDTGIGIPQDHLDNLFTPFEKRKARQGNNEDGTGLGLVICRELSRLLGGDVTVESEVDIGTTFTVRLPTDLSLDDEKGCHSHSREHVEFDTSRVFRGIDPEHRPRVLIVDDDPDSTDLLKDELEAANCDVFTASNGLAGIEYARQLKPDLIALDIVMPGMDGWEVLQRLKKDEGTKNIPVILVTIVGESRKGLTLGADGYLTKPFEPSELKRVFGRVLGRHAGTVLIVDDDAVSREIARDACGETEFIIREANNGEDALEQIIDEVPDAILLDLNMPKMDGFELVEQLRSRRLLAQSKIIVVTGRELSQDERASLSDAVVSFFDKAAVDEDQLKRELRRLLHKSLSTTASA